MYVIIYVKCTPSEVEEVHIQTSFGNGEQSWQEWVHWSFKTYKGGEGQKEGGGEGKGKGKKMWHRGYWY